MIGEPPVELLQDLPNLEWIQMTWAGADRYTNDPAFPCHITLTNASGAYGATIAEHAIAMLLALYRRLPGYLRQQRQTQWMDLGAEMALDGQTVVILGAGNIGRETARRLRGFDTTVVGVRRSGAAMMPEFTSVTGIENLERLLPQADVLIGCLPDTPQTRGLLSRERLAQLKPGAVFINVGRGSLVDTEALTEALQSGHLAGAGLDVTDPEPLPPGTSAVANGTGDFDAPCGRRRFWSSAGDRTPYSKHLPGECPPLCGGTPAGEYCGFFHWISQQQLRGERQ